MISESAPGKVILTGEHAVVYGFPAIAVPVINCRALATITDSHVKGINITAKQLNENFFIEPDKENYHPIELTVINFLKKYNPEKTHGFTIDIFSEIPVASGMGSGAAISTAIIKALSSYFKIKISKEELFLQVMEIEKIYHGNPSGIDPKVIIFEKPYYFIKNGITEELPVNNKFVLVIIDSGLRSSTRNVVNRVGEQHKINPYKYEKIFTEIGNITNSLKELLITENADMNEVGKLLNQNHELLKEMGVSNPELDEIVSKLTTAGAFGAKMSGAGWGGIVIGLVEKSKVGSFREKLGMSKIIFS